MTDHKELRKQGELIALHLGRPWKFNGLREPSDWSFEIIDGEGRGLFFRCEYGASQKYRVSGLFCVPKVGRYMGHSPSIGVSRTRNPKAIAADITRRLLPDYLAAYDQAIIQHAQHKAREEKKRLITQALLKVTGGYQVRYSDDVFFTAGKIKLFYGSPEHLDMELRNLTPDQAIRIAAMLTEEHRATTRDNIAAQG